MGAPTFAARPQPRPALPTLPSRRVQSSGDRRKSAPAFASQSSLPAAPVHQVTVEPENAVADYDYDPGLSRSVCVCISISRNISVHQVPTFQASPEGKAGSRGDRETEGKQESCQSCQKEEDSGVNEIYGG